MREGGTDASKGKIGGSKENLAGKERRLPCGSPLRGEQLGVFLGKEKQGSEAEREGNYQEGNLQRDLPERKELCLPWS